MKFHNIRFGFATNSSSSHSLILLRPGDHDAATKEDIQNKWTRFSLGDKEVKIEYLYSLLYYFLQDREQYGWESEKPTQILKEWTDCEDPDELIYSDTQDFFSFPRERQSSCVNRAYFEDLKTFFEREDFFIFRGSDGQEQEVLEGLKKEFKLEFDHVNMGALRVMRKSIARFDPQYKYWTCFQPSTGLKVRFSLEDIRQDPTKASTPELVDLKITNRCHHACPFCYQGSHSKGKHASLEDIRHIATSLAELEVFEVAVGGGEVTEHPQFVDVLRVLRAQGLTPNVTVRSLRSLPVASLTYLGGVAVSVHRYADLERLEAYLSTPISNVKGKHILRCEFNTYPGGFFSKELPFLTFQHVVGTATEAELASMLKKAAYLGVHMTLLGYKNVGRGPCFTPHEVDVIKVLNDTDTGVIKIDTVLAQEYQQRLKEINIPDYMYDVEDGKFSMYIDAVEGLVGASSWVEPEYLEASDMTAETLKAQFERY